MTFFCKRNLVTMTFLGCNFLCILAVYLSIQAATQLLNFTIREPFQLLPLFEDNFELPSSKSPPITIHFHSEKSYRALPVVRGWMETNKMQDDYNFCPRIESFLGPYEYVNNSKNPCWQDQGVLRCLPYFYLAGFSKCATTDLFWKISKHPDMLVTGHKEKHWFDYERFIQGKGLIQNYTDMFTNVTKTIQEEINKYGSSKKITGDGTPCYVWGSLNWPCYQGNQNLSEPLYTNADVIYRLNPRTKVIIMVREPVNRLYSRMLTWVGQPIHPAYLNPTPQKFHTFLQEKIATYLQCFRTSSVRQCAYNGTLYKETVLRLMEGVYAVYLKDWLRVFGREQILIIKFEDYISKHADTLTRVFEFLELAPLSQLDLTRMSSLRTNAGLHYDVGALLNESRRLLEAFYQPFNSELARLLRDPHMTWNYTQP